MSAPDRSRPTPHQATVLGRIYRESGNVVEVLDDGTERNVGSASSLVIGCRSACEHLERKGLISVSIVEGPRGGITYRYRVTELGRRKVPARFVTTEEATS